MEYKGKLYGKVGDEYFPLQETTEDYEQLKRRLEKSHCELKFLKSKIRNLKFQKIIDIDNSEKDTMLKDVFQELKKIIHVREEVVPQGKKVTMEISVFN